MTAEDTRDAKDKTPDGQEPDGGTRPEQEAPGQETPPEETPVPEAETGAPEEEVQAAEPDETPTEEKPAAEKPAEEKPAEEKTPDRLLRALAENENTIRRARKEREDTAKYAVANLARDVLTVADNLRRALEAIPDELRDANGPATGFVDGVELTERELLATMERHSIKKIDPMGERFDHNFHEAMFEVPTADAEPGTVVQVLQVGYIIHDRLLRAAQVGIAKALPESGEQHQVDTTA